MQTYPDNLTPAERELEEALRGLKPATVSLDHDRLMFEAGRRSARSHLHAWQAVAAMMMIGLGMSWLMRPASAPADRIHRNVPPTSETFVSLASATAAGGETSYCTLRGRFLKDGADALPVLPEGTRSPIGRNTDQEANLLRSREQLNNL